MLFLKEGIATFVVLVLETFTSIRYLEIDLSQVTLLDTAGRSCLLRG